MLIQRNANYPQTLASYLNSILPKHLNKSGKEDNPCFRTTSKNWRCILYSGDYLSKSSRSRHQNAAAFPCEPHPSGLGIKTWYCGKTYVRGIRAPFLVFIPFVQLSLYLNCSGGNRVYLAISRLSL